MPWAGAAAEAEGVGLEWRTADAEALPFADAAFDVVLSSIGVMFAPHHQGLIVDRFASGAEFRGFFKANYGPTIAVYPFIADDAENVARAAESGCRRALCGAYC